MAARMDKVSEDRRNQEGPENNGADLPDGRGYMDKITKAIDKHLETMTEGELIMVLKYIHALKDLR